MKRSDTLLRRPLYTALTWLIVATFVIMVPGKNLAEDARRSSAKREAQAISVAEGTSKIVEISDAALAKGSLTANEYASTLLDIREIESRMGNEHPIKVVDKLLAITSLTAEESRTGGIGRAISQEEVKRYGDNSPKFAQAIVNSLIVGCWFIPLALMILVLRLATLARTPRQLLAMARANWQELTGASIFWGIGLSAYQPEQNLFGKIARLGYCEDTDVQTDWNQKRQELAALFEFGQFRMASPFQALRAMLSVIWSGDWRKASLGVRFVYAKQATYVSLIGVLMIVTGQMRAYASDDGFILQRTTISYNKMLGVNSPAAEHLFLNFEGGVSAIIFGYSSPSPTLELSHATGRLKSGDLSLSYGPFMSYGLGSGKIVSYGASSFAVLGLGEATMTAPVYLTQDPRGVGGLSIPNLRLTVPAGKDTDIGIGGAAFASTGSYPTYLLGPTIRTRFRDSTIAIRLGQFLSGPLKGQNQLRLDFSFVP